MIHAKAKPSFPLPRPRPRSLPLWVRPVTPRSIYVGLNPICRIAGINADPYNHVPLTLEYSRYALSTLPRSGDQDGEVDQTKLD